MAYNWKNAALFGPLGGLSGGKKKGNGMNMIKPDPYEGLRPYSGAEVGLGAADLTPLSQQYKSQIMERSRGEGLVGFDPKRSQLAKENLRLTLGEREEERRRQDQAQAASQGLRGGIPMDIARRRTQDFDR